MSISADSKQVLLLINQFLREHNLHKTAECLQDESGISNLSTTSLPVRSQIHTSIISGNWVTALELLSPLSISKPTRSLLNIQVTLELCENGESSAAQSLLRSLTFLKTSDAERWLELEQICVTPFMKSYYVGGRDNERSRIADLVAGEIEIVEEGRLLALLGQAAKWKNQSGRIETGDYDFMADKNVIVEVGDEDLPAIKEYNRIKARDPIY